MIRKKDKGRRSGQAKNKKKTRIGTREDQGRTKINMRITSRRIGQERRLGRRKPEEYRKDESRRPDPDQEEFPGRRKEVDQGKKTQEEDQDRDCAADFSLLNLPKGKSLGRSKPATNS